MSAYKELLAEKAELERKIAAVRREEIKSAVEAIRETIAELNLTEEDIFGYRRGTTDDAVKVKKAVAAKYRDPETGATWTGRGKAPRWIDGKDRDAFLI
ncbi:MAG: H-NS histone family protein [Pseudomonas sp.]|jgi:DNA-binding protein H-NS|nr:H-NS histone family protein [Pseudomonas sp.]